jgi:1-phosphofructokinase family hexose kinase
MILVVCLNPALDVTHYVSAVDWAGVNRPTAVHTRPGGKGLNVARTLHALGADVLLMGLAGGDTGRAVEAALRQAGVPSALIPISGLTRHTFTVVDDAGTTASFNEAGPEVTAHEFDSLRMAYLEALATTDAVVLSGSLPPGLPVTTYAALIQAAAAAGVPVLLDSNGAALLQGVSAGPAIVKPNLDELAGVTGKILSASGSVCAAHTVDRAAVRGAATELRAAGADAVVASLGPAGLLAVTAEGCWHAWPSAVAAGNATGAGDAVAAALVHGLVARRPWDERLRHAVALGAAAVAAPVAGEFRRESYLDGLRPVAVRLEEVR